MSTGKRIAVGLSLLLVSLGVILGNWKNSWMPAISAGYILHFLWRALLAAFNIMLIFLAGFMLQTIGQKKTVPRAWIWQLAYAWVWGVAGFVVMGIFLLTVKLYSPLAWNVVSLLILISALLHYQSRRRQGSKPVWVPPDRVWKKSQAEPRITGNPFFFVMGTIFLAMAVVQLWVLPNFRDELAYHLFIPKLWEFQHHFGMTADNFHLLFPANIEVIWGFSMAQGGVHTTRFMTFIFGLLTLMCLRQAFREWQMNSWIIDFSTLFLLITPVALIGLVICYVEWPLFFFMFCGWYAAKRYVQHRQTADLLLTAVAWGCSLGSKYTALPIVGLLFLDWCTKLYGRGYRREIGRALLVTSVSTLIFLGPWAARNFLVVGNPLHPLTPRGVISPQSGTDTQGVATLVSYSGIHGAWKLNPWLYHATVEKKLDERLHIGWPILLIAVLLLGWKWRRELPWHALVALIILFFYLAPSSRIYFPLLGLCLLFLPYLIHEIVSSLGLRRLLQGLLLIYALPSLAVIFTCFYLSYNRCDQDYALGIKDDATYLRDSGIVTPVQFFIRERLPKDSRLWAWGEDEGFYFERWLLPTSPYGTPVFLDLARNGGEEALTHKIMQNRITYLVIHRENCNLPAGTIRRETIPLPLEPETRAVLQTWIERNFKLLVKDQRYELYQLRDKKES